MISDETKFKALYEHYNDTFSNIKESIRLRDKLTAFILILLALIALYTFWPASALEAFTQITTQKLGFSTVVNIEYLGSIIWGVLMIVIIRYTQTVVYIERQYAYIHRIEQKLHDHYTDNVSFTREGKSYLEKYPTFSNWIYILYTIILPVLLLAIILTKIVSEWTSASWKPAFPVLLNTAFALCITVSIILYMIFVHKQNK